MKSTSVWEGGFRSKITNSDGHSVTVDLPKENGGEGAGMTALELNAMSFGGCFNTIFMMLAGKMRLKIAALETEVVAEHPAGSKTITEAHLKIKVKSGDEDEKIENCVLKTIAACPVGVLYVGAGVVLTHETLIEK